MRGLCERLARESPSPGNPREATVVPLHASFVRDLRPKMLAISAAAIFVLLIVGANFASLLLARHAREGSRDRASRRPGRLRADSLVRAYLVESLVLTAAGSVTGVLLAFWLTGPLVALSPMASDATGSALREFDSAVRIDGPVLVASVGVALLVGLGFGLVAAWRGSRGDLQAVLKGSGARGDAGPRHDASSRAS